MKATSGPPTQNEWGWDEELKKTVESKIRQLNLALHRLAQLEGTLWDPSMQLIEDALTDCYEEAQCQYAELQGEELDELRSAKWCGLATAGYRSLSRRASRERQSR